MIWPGSLSAAANYEFMSLIHWSLLGLAPTFFSFLKLGTWLRKPAGLRKIHPLFSGPPVLIKGKHWAETFICLFVYCFYFYPAHPPFELIKDCRLIKNISGRRRLRHSLRSFAFNTPPKISSPCTSSCSPCLHFPLGIFSLFTTFLLKGNVFSAPEMWAGAIL